MPDNLMWDVGCESSHPNDLVSSIQYREFNIQHKNPKINLL